MPLKHKDSFADLIVRKFYSHPDVLTNFDLLKKIDVISSFENLVSAFRDLELLQQKAVSIFSFDDLESLYNFIIESILHKFIPTYLLFVVKSDRYSQKPAVACYKNLKKIDSPVTFEDVSIFEKYFLSRNGMVILDEKKFIGANNTVFEQLLIFSPRLLIPIKSASNFYGFVLVGKQLLDAPYSESEKFFIETIIQFASVSIQNILNHRWSITDSKTGLYCFEYLKEQIKQEVLRSKRHKRPLALVEVDIDFFKKFNDNYGHQCGDLIILEVAKLLQRNCRSEDVICRFGGDEFMILLPETTLKDAQHFALRLMGATANLKISHQDITSDFLPTISVGVAVYNGDSDIGYEEFISISDKALYHSKNNGRNCCSLFEYGTSSDFLLFTNQNEDKKLSTTGLLGRALASIDIS